MELYLGSFKESRKGVHAVLNQVRPWDDALTGADFVVATDPRHSVLGLARRLDRELLEQENRAESVRE